MNNKTYIPVLAPNDETLMPMTYKRAQARVESGRAEWVSNDLQIKCIRLLEEPSGYVTQPICVGVDDGKHFAGIGVQSSQATLGKFHLCLPYKHVTKKMTARRILRRARRGRRINRKVAFHLRAHRQKRFDNRRQKGLPPSIRANKELILRVVTELSKLFPITEIRYEVVKARTENGKGKGFSPVMVGQKRLIEWLGQLAPVSTQEGWQTSILRQQLGLAKNREDKSAQTPETHSNDGVALASSPLMRFEKFQTAHKRGHRWIGQVRITSAPFRVIARPNLYRRQLHFENPLKGGERKRKGGTVTPWDFRSGDFVKGIKAGKTYRGWIGGFSEVNKVISLYDHNWRRIGQFSVSKVQLIKRSTRLCVA
jgi:hypothetical protein